MVKQKTSTSLQALEELLSKIETDIKRARLMIHQMTDDGKKVTNKKEDIDTDKLTEQLSTYTDEENIKIVEGVYDGYFMV